MTSRSRGQIAWLGLAWAPTALIAWTSKVASEFQVGYKDSEVIA